MAEKGHPDRGGLHVNSVDRRGRQISPAVLNAAEAIGQRALRHAERLLIDPAVAANLLEEAAATVSRATSARSSSQHPISGEDGFLQTSEVVQLPINADLVVLSSCDTAVGPIQGEEGIETLSRAFLLAGARTVISTLWSIDDDSTLFLMKSFYAQLARKKTTPYALRVAKINMLSTFGPTKALPYYWAGFTVEGLAPSPVQK